MNRRILSLVGILLISTCIAGAFLPSQAVGQTFTQAQTESYIERLYNIVLQRDSDPPGLTSNVNLAVSIGDAFVRTVAEGFLLSPEFLTGFGVTPSSFVTTLYLSVLNRVPSDTEVDFHVALLDTARGGQVTSFLNSAEFVNSVSPTLNESSFLDARPMTLNTAEQAVFITRLYNVLLGRDPDSQGFQDHFNALKSGGRDYLDDAILAFLESPEFDALISSSPADPNKLISALYLVFFNRAPDPAGLSNWVSALQAGTKNIAAIVSDFKGSSEGHTVLQTRITQPEFLLDRPTDPDRGFTQTVYTPVSQIISLVPTAFTTTEQQELVSIQDQAILANVAAVVAVASPSSP